VSLRESSALSAANRPAMPYGWGRVAYAYADRVPWMNLPFPVEEYQERLGRLREKMARAGLDCVVVLGNRADNSSIRYLTNFEDFYGGESMLVVAPSASPGFTTNAVMHGEPMHSGIQDCWVEDVRCAAAPRTITGGAQAATVFDHVEDFIRDLHCTAGTIGVAGELGAERLYAFLRETFAEARVLPAQGLMADLRAFKSPREIAVMRKACHLADVAMQAAMDAVRPGVTEHDLAAEANHAMFKAGAEHPAFALSVVAGQRAGFKHMAPTSYQIRAGDMVYIDVGGRYMGYYSDGSRQRVCGEPSPEQRRFMETQIQMVEAVTRAAKPGTVIDDLAATATAIAREHGYDQYLYFRGHGIGCATHDLPSLAPGNPARLAENMVFCLEPMLVKRNFGTACWEDIWCVVPAGLERLNACPVRWW
jgi:Xaa-Pro aminopeptidase